MTDQSNAPKAADFAAALAATSVVVNLTMSAWHPNKTDRTLSDDVADANNARSGAFSVRKSLLAGADKPFRDIAAVQNDLRAAINSMTVPFGVSTMTRTQGPRLLSNNLILDFTEKVEQARAKMQALVAAACASYDLAKATAQINLGDAYRESDYPPASTLARMFSIHTSIEPVPDARSFKRVSGTGMASLYDTLAAGLEDTLAAKAEAARADLEERAAEALTRINARLDALKKWMQAGGEGSGERKPALYQSMHDEARQIAEIIDCYSSAIGLSPVMQNAALALTGIGALTPEALHKDEAVLDEALRAAKQAYSCF